MYQCSLHGSIGFSSPVSVSDRPVLIKKKERKEKGIKKIMNFFFSLSQMLVETRRSPDLSFMQELVLVPRAPESSFGMAPKRRPIQNMDTLNGSTCPLPLYTNIFSLMSFYLGLFCHGWLVRLLVVCGCLSSVVSTCDWGLHGSSGAMIVATNPFQRHLNLFGCTLPLTGCSRQNS